MHLRRKELEVLNGTMARALSLYCITNTSGYHHNVCIFTEPWTAARFQLARWL